MNYENFWRNKEDFFAEQFGVKEGYYHEISPSSKNKVNLFMFEKNKGFVVKHAPKYCTKELEVFNIMNKYNLGGTLDLLFAGDDFYITKYESTLRSYESFEKFISDIARMHLQGMSIPAMDSESFKNKNRDKSIDRVIRHPDLVKNFYTNIDKLVSYMDSNKNALDEQPKVFVHGDIHKNNVCSTQTKEFVYLDFELAVYDYPSWDLSRILFGLDINDDKPIYSYLNILNGAIDKEAQRKRIDIDFIFKYCGVGIGVQQHEYFREYVPRYMKTINQRFEKILD